MIRVEVGKMEKGRFEYIVSAYGINGGPTYTPLLDACRELKRMGVDTSTKACLFYPRSSDWAVRCSVGWGADHAVFEKSRCFVPYKEFNRDSF